MLPAIDHLKAELWQPSDKIGPIKLNETLLLDVRYSGNGMRLLDPLHKGRPQKAINHEGDRYDRNNPVHSLSAKNRQLPQRYVE